MAVSRQTPGTKITTNFSIGNLIKCPRFSGVFLIIGQYVVGDLQVDNWIVLCPDEQTGHVAKTDLEWERVA